MAELTLHPGGILHLVRWGDEEINDVSDVAFHYLSENIQFVDDVILKDVFLLIDKNLDMFSAIFGNWIEEYTALALSETEQELDRDMDYLELYRVGEIDGEEFTMDFRPSFHGVGVVKEDTEYNKKGEVVQWGISFTPTNELAHLPVKLSDKLAIYNTKTKETFNYKCDDYSLFDIIQGIIWELSFYGSPEKTKDVLDGLNNQMARIESGEEKLIEIKFDAEEEL